MNNPTGSTVVPVVLCGGSGTRLWPLSREAFPKQFHRFIGEHTLFAGTVLRAAQVASHGRVAIICNEQHRFIAAEQAREVFAGDLLTVLEPVARNTAAAIAAVAELLKDDDPVLVVLPSDHHLPDVDAFTERMGVAIEAARAGYLVTFGISPSAPETGYGYIEAASQVVGHGAFKVERFIEKPPLEEAKRLVKTGRHTWNSGMFVMQASVFLRELAQHEPAVHQAVVAAVQGAGRDTDFVRLGKAAFEQSPNISVDYAVLERSNNVAVVPFSGAWSDLGSWSAVAEISHLHASAGNSHGIDDVVQHHAQRNHVHADKPVVLVGVDDLVVVDTPDALLVTHRDRAQGVKDALAQLSKLQPNLAKAHRKVYRPWGWYDSLDFGGTHQVKRIHVKPGQRLSLQSHQHRAEHWVVVQGTATVTVKQATRDYQHGEHVFIPLRELHRLENRTREAVEVIEVQCGSYLGEDDIVRYHDLYGRADTAVPTQPAN